MTDTTQTKDDFSAAFAEFSVPEEKKEDTQAAEGGQADGGTADATATVDSSTDTGADTSATGDTAGGDTGEQNATETTASTEAGSETTEATGTEGAEATAGETAAAAQPEAKQADPNVDDTLRRLAELVKEKPAEEKKPEVAEEKKPEQAPLYSEEEQAVLDAYDKEWPDIAKAEGLRRRAEYRELVQYVFEEVSKYLTPVKDTVEALAERTMLTDLKSTVPDYNDTLRDKVIAWVDTQPAYLQGAYKQVIQQGTVDEVTDLIDRYRKSTGVGAPAAASTNKVTELSSEAKQAAAALAPVSTKRTVVQQQDDPSDFDGAFARFLGKV